MLPCITQNSFRLKKGLKFGTFSIDVEFSYARGHIQPPIIFSNIQTKIGPEIGHFQVAKCKIFIGKADHKTNLD